MYFSWFFFTILSLCGLEFLLCCCGLWCLVEPWKFKLCSGGFAWKKQGGGKIIEVDKADITSVAWMRIPKSYQLNVGTKEGLFYRFFGFRQQVIFPWSLHYFYLKEITYLYRLCLINMRWKSMWPHGDFSVLINLLCLCFYLTNGIIGHIITRKVFNFLLGC
jgi:hypothetical protein